MTVSAISTKNTSSCNAASTCASLLAALCMAWAGPSGAAIDPGMTFADGRSIYRFYCYQCHAYSGNARTLSSTYLDPQPRDFTAETHESLPLERMLDAVRNGRPGTAMVNFDAVLTDRQIEMVVAYVRAELVGNPDSAEKYHSPENGWENHERYRAAYPFVEGEIPLGTPPADLTEEQRAGRMLYESACVSCHDQPNSGGSRAIWETRAVSYPRQHYSHREAPLDIVSAASPYARHDVPVVPKNMTDQQRQGMQLYQDNCAFCHAPDGTAQNWIGSFLEPRPRDFTSRDFALHEAPEAFREVVKHGIPNSSMPAWRHVLTDEEIDAIVSYIAAAFAR
jgi:cytochrome c oxidase cbb3-type subunit 3